MIRIIHVSDLHLESESPSLDKTKIINTLARDIKSYITPETIFVFTGDLIDRGGIGFSDKINAFQNFERLFIDKMLEENPCLKGKFFIVPGNHDVFREKIDTYSETGLKNKLIDSKSLNSFLESNKIHSNHLGRTEDYKKWEKQFYEKYNTAIHTNFDTTLTINLNGYKIGVSCLNSSWFCKDDDDKGSIFLGRGQVENSLQTISDCHIKIALSHHPLEFFVDFDRESIKIPIYKNYDMLFTGHVHEISSSYTQDLVGNIFISIANSTIGDFPVERKFVNGYTIIDFYPNEKIETEYRKYIEQHEKFVANTDIGADNGKMFYKILINSDLDHFEKALSIVSNIEHRLSDQLNEHIIMSSLHTNTNCSIDNLFVEPTLLNTPPNSIKEEHSRKYSIDDILNDKDNYLIYGLKESGKTILLDKMFLDSARRFNQINKIPILIKFSDFKTKQLLRVIREFVEVSSTDIENFLRDNRILLFIDDVQFGEKYTNQLAQLTELLERFSTIQIISTCSVAIENTIPLDYLHYNNSLKYNVIYIQNLNTNEIKQLITKWFSGREVDLHDNMQRLIKNFVDFGLPKTPLTVTLFLWIFEKQEKRPINNSVLVEIFVENLLEKTNVENIYAETFDFLNKKRLLSWISKYMNDNGDPDLSYAVEYVSLLSFVNDYLKTRFTGQPQKVLEDFVKRGILTYVEDNMLRFKSAFFFHYFLSLQFRHDSGFKQYVFSEKNYLNYIEEIGYYTGLERDDLSVLLFTQQKLLEAFNERNNGVGKDSYRVDKVLESKRNNTITFSIDEDKAKDKMSEGDLDKIYDDSLSAIPVQSDIPKKDVRNIDSEKSLDKILKLASVVLKNSEDIDDYEEKKKAYNNILISSISFLMMYRDSLISYYLEYNKKPEHFPKNVDFHLFIKIIPMIHQVVLYEWLGTSKLRPVLLDKINLDDNTSNISNYERFLSIFIYSDIRGAGYPDLIEKFVKYTQYNYLKDISYLKIMSYYHLRNNGSELDHRYLQIMAKIKEDLGHISKNQKSEFMKKIENKKKKLK